MSVRLRDYQLDAVERIMAAIARGVRRMLVVLPTGTGKTICFAHLAWQLGGRTLIVAHREELLQQAADKIRLVDSTADIGIVQGATNEVDHDIVIASIQTLARDARLGQLGVFDRIIIDEAHHSTARSYRRVIEQLGGFRPAGPVVIGFTATPGRADGVGLGVVFEEVVYERTILEMLSLGHLADLQAKRIQIAADYRNLSVHRGDFDADEVGRILLDAGAPRAARDAYRLHAADRKATLVFAPTVETSKAFAAAFSEAGIPAAHVDGETPRDERADSISRLQTGDLAILANCSLLTEGVDVPAVDCIIIARPTRSTGLYQQMLGRGTRPHPGKADCLVLDLVGSTTRHDLVTAADLLGLDPSELENGRTVTEALEARQRVPGMVDASGELVARAVNLFQRRPPHWLNVDGRYLLTVDQSSHIELRPQADGGDHWTATLHERGRLSSVLATDVPLTYAAGVATDHVRRYGAVGLAISDARWRRDPMTAKQAAHLQRLGITPPDGCTKGQASDLIAVEQMRRTA